MKMGDKTFILESPSFSVVEFVTSVQFIGKYYLRFTDCMFAHLQFKPDCDDLT